MICLTDGIIDSNGDTGFISSDKKFIDVSAISSRISTSCPAGTDPVSNRV